MASASRVAVFCPGYFLPYSQTFIYDEVAAHQRYEADVFAWGRRNSDRFPFPRVHTPDSFVDGSRYLATAQSAAFERVFQARQPRLVHAHFGTSTVRALPYAHRYRVPLVVTFHGYDVALLAGRNRYLPHRWRYWSVARRMFQEAAVLLCASEELRQMVTDLSGRRDVQLFQLGIELSRFDRPRVASGTPRVTMIGRFVEKKGHLDGIAAFARAVRAAPARLSIVGSGPLEGQYRALARRLGIESAVDFHGALAPQAVAELLARTDVLLAPSHVARNGDRESGLLVVREAGAAGVPVVGTRHGGIPESIEHGRTGFLVAERDVAELAQRLEELLTSPALARQLGDAARAKVCHEFDLRTQVAKLESIYDAALAGAR
jgi:glycosyltransferase involved in cell wall biosynthesis